MAACNDCEKLQRELDQTNSVLIRTRNALEISQIEFDLHKIHSLEDKLKSSLGKDELNTLGYIVRETTSKLYETLERLKNEEPK